MGRQGLQYRVHEYDAVKGLRADPFGFFLLRQ